MEGLVVQGQRALQEGGAAEGHQADAIPLEHGQQIVDFTLGAVQAGGLNVLGQHAAGAVQGNDQVDAPLLHGLPSKAVLGTGQGHHHQQQGQQHQGRPPATADREAPGGQQMPRAGMGKAFQDPASPAAADKIDQARQRHDPYQEQHVDAYEVHGILKNRVLIKSIHMPKRDRAGKSK